jgi:hypothetical protein
MTDVPDDSVSWCIEDVVERDREFHNAEAGTQVASGHCYSVNRLGPKLIGHLMELALFELTQIVGGMDLIKQGRFGRFGHQ